MTIEINYMDNKYVVVVGVVVLVVEVVDVLVVVGVVDVLQCNRNR